MTGTPESTASEVVVFFHAPQQKLRFFIMIYFWSGDTD